MLTYQEEWSFKNLLTKTLIVPTLLLALALEFAINKSIILLTMGIAITNYALTNMATKLLYTPIIVRDYFKTPENSEAQPGKVNTSNCWAGFWGGTQNGSRVNNNLPGLDTTQVSV